MRVQQPDEQVKVAREDKEQREGPPEDSTLDDEGNPRFVGDLTIKRDSDEPILRESPRRFVLFPILYHEVRSGLFHLYAAQKSR
jgi:hypothetical protein